MLFFFFFSFLRVLCFFRHQRRCYLHFVEWKFFHVSAGCVLFSFTRSLATKCCFSLFFLCSFVRVCPIILVRSTGYIVVKFEKVTAKQQILCLRCSIDSVCIGGTCRSPCTYRCQVRMCVCFLLSFFVFFHFFALYRFCVLSGCLTVGRLYYNLSFFLSFFLSFVGCVSLWFYAIPYLFIHLCMLLFWIWVNDFFEMFCAALFPNNFSLSLACSLLSLSPFLVSFGAFACNFVQMCLCAVSLCFSIDSKAIDKRNI